MPATPTVSRWAHSTSAGPGPFPTSPTALGRSAAASSSRADTPCCSSHRTAKEAISFSPRAPSSPNDGLMEGMRMRSPRRPRTASGASGSPLIAPDSALRAVRAEDTFEDRERLVQPLRRRRRGEPLAQRLHGTEQDRVVRRFEQREIVQAVPHPDHLEARALHALHHTGLLPADAELPSGDPSLRVDLELVREQVVAPEPLDDRLRAFGERVRDDHDLAVAADPVQELVRAEV